MFVSLLRRECSWKTIQSCAGVLDGFSPVGVESAKDVEDRLALLKIIGYKR